MRKHHLAIAFGLLAACAHDAASAERVIGVAPLGKDVFASVDIRQFESSSFTSKSGMVIPYRLLRPSAPQAGKTYPLVIQFHGSGGIGTDNSSQLDRLARSWAGPEIQRQYPAYVLVPQFPVRSANYGPASTGSAR